MILSFILILLYIEVSESIVIMLKMNIVMILPLLYMVIGVVTFGINNIITLEAGRVNVANIINITIGKSGINKVITLLLICVSIIILWLFILIIETEINTVTIKVIIFNINNIIILLFILL